MTIIGGALRATAIVLLSAVFGLILIEGLTRLLLPQFDPSGRFAFDHESGPFALATPGYEGRQVKNTGDFDVAVRINRHGLRDANDVAEATPDDIVVVGDSFAWGWGVEAGERFSNRLEGIAGRRTFNVSAPTNIEGYAALLAFAERLGAKIGQVVVAVCLENDLDHGQATGDRGSRAALRDILARHSAAYLFITTVVHRTFWLKAPAIRLGLVRPYVAGIGGNVDEPKIVEASADRLEDIARHYRTLVLLIPSRGLWLGDNREVEDRVHRRLIAALERRGLDVLDMRPVLEAAGDPLAFHFANDGHWNAQGHAQAAEAIGKRLRGK